MTYSFDIYQSCEVGFECPERSNVLVGARL